MSGIFVSRPSWASIFVFGFFVLIVFCAIFFGPAGIWIGIPQLLGLSEPLGVSDFLNLPLGEKIIKLFYSLVVSFFAILTAVSLAEIIDSFFSKERGDCYGKTSKGKMYPRRRTK